MWPCGTSTNCNKLPCVKKWCHNPPPVAWCLILWDLTYSNEMLSYMINDKWKSMWETCSVSGLKWRLDEHFKGWCNVDLSHLQDYMPQQLLLHRRLQNKNWNTHRHNMLDCSKQRQLLLHWPAYLPMSLSGRGPYRSIKIPNGNVAALRRNEPMVKPRFSTSSCSTQLFHSLLTIDVRLLLIVSFSEQGYNKVKSQ